MYGTRQGQTAHERYIRDHYREADTAEMDYNIHSRFEKYVRAVSLRCLP